MTIARHLKSYGVLTLRRDSPIYKLGKKTYRRLRSLLKRLSFHEPTGFKNARQLAAIARAAGNCQVRDDAERILFLTVRGWFVHLATETMIAARLRQMGHSVSFLICADSVPFCMLLPVNFPEEGQHDCVGCGYLKAILPGTYFDTDKLYCPPWAMDEVQNVVADLGIQECRHFQWDGFPYGELVYPSVVWFLRRATLKENDAPLYRKALVSAHATRIGLESKIAEQKPDTVVMLNGDFNVEQVSQFVLKRLGVRYVTHDYTFHERLGVAANASVWDELTFSNDNRTRPPVVTETEYAQAEKLLKQWRRTGGYQGSLFWKSRDLARSADELRQKLGLDSRPLAAAYTNLTFESSVLGKDRAFKNQFSWLSELVEWFAARPQYQLAIRIHPAEVRNDHWRPNESLFDFVANEMTPLPSNVHLIAPSATASSYALGALARVILVYGSTLGMEMAERRKQVITAAHVHYAGRGFTSDPATPIEYFEVLENCMEKESRLSEEGRDAVVRYVAWFIFRRLAAFEPLSGIREEDWPRVRVKQLADLSNPKLLGFQQICRLIADDVSWW